MPKHVATRLPDQQRGAKVAFTVDGKTVEAYRGEMLAAALMASGIIRLRYSPHAVTPRGAFCLMGVCQECIVRIDGKVRQACLATVTGGLEVQFIDRIDEARPT
jgi:predicted molibdopterin-dependent oxidoreductase YjgC